MALTTGQVARITQSSIGSVIRWFNSGLLKSWKVPGSRFRRIEPADLREFMQRHEMPMDRLDGLDGAILVVTADNELTESLSKAVFGSRKAICRGPFEAGITFATLTVKTVVLDCEVGEAAMRGVVDAALSRSPAISVFGIAGRHGQGIAGLECFPRDNVSGALRDALEGQKRA